MLAATGESKMLRMLIVAGAALSFCQATVADTKGSTNRPNVVLIMTDDQGFGDLGINGNPIIRTPNIDRMARASARMENFYVSPVCAPTRACLMTGRYNYRTRCIDTYIGRAMMDPDEVTIAELLGRAGYATGIFGKWHLGDNYPMRANDQGFEEALVHRGGGIAQPSDPPGGGSYFDPLLFHNGKQVKAKGYCTDVYFRAGLEWIEHQQKAGRPFFCYLPTNCPHSPFQVRPEDLALYENVDLSNERFPQKVGHSLPKKTNTATVAKMYGMISNIDDNVGRLFAKLDALDLTRDTIVIFMTDNGPAGPPRYKAGMKGAKAHVHEAGVRSPFFVHWPARLKPGHSSDRIAAHIDVLPTLLEVCGARKPSDLQLDGKSLLPLLEGKPIDWPERTIFIQSHRGNAPIRYHHFMARAQDWKLLNASGFGKEKFVGPPKFELYDMANDPLEMKDLAAERPEIVADLKRRYEQWFADVCATRGFDPPRIHLGTTHENPVTLTRQDWRRVSSGNGWAPTALGHWEVTVATPGSYTIQCRFPPEKVGRHDMPGTARLEVAGLTRTVPLKPNAPGCRFDAVPLPRGDARLIVRLEHAGKVKGVYQIDVAKLD